MSVESRLAQRNRTETEKLLAQEKAEAGLKSMAIGPITGTLGLPSDILDLTDMANDAIAKYGEDTVTGQFSKLIKPTLDKLQEKYGREAFDRGFTELTGIKSDSTNPAQILGELVSLGGLAKTGVKGAKIVGNTMSDTYQGAKKLFQDASDGTGGGSLQAVNRASINSVDETSKLVDKTKVDAPINTDIPTLKAEDLSNKPIVNPSMIGAETELGQKQIGLYEKLIKDSKALGGKAPTQERLFERTGVYKGSDGKYRFDLDDRDAAFNTTFLENSLVKNPNMKNPPTLLSGNIVSYSGLNPKLFNLREVLDFDSLYKQYGKTLKVGDKAYSNIGNLKVKFTSKTNGVRGSYSGDTDTITLNITDTDGFRIKDLGQIESTLLHEVQHAIQRREGFNYGSNMDNFLRSGYTQDYKTNAALQDNILARLSNDLEDGLTYLTDSNKLGFLSDLEVKSKRINRIENMPSADKTDVIKKEYMDLTASRADDVARIDLPQAQKKKVFNNFNKAMDKNARQRKLLDREESIAYEKYRDVYGEREARLVQERYKKRKTFKSMSGGLDFGEDKVSSIMSKDTSFLENMTNKKAQGGLQLAKGGTVMNMNRQMEMFEEGGLKDEGGTIDPVSGNDVPSGSTQEEVRDDIPAQLSEGEFVFPADVTRFIGLEKLMQMRQEAKAGLKRMEDMGQMGNSEEATMPDDVPFSIEDLDTEEEEEYTNDSQEMNKGGMIKVGGVEMPKPRIQGQQMAEGGVVKAATGTFVNQGTGVTTIPSQFAGQNLPSYNPNQTLQTGVSPAYTVPTIPAVTTGYDPKFMTGQEMQTNQTAPSFETLIGKNPGQYDEMRTYKNDAGASLQIPFKNGQPIYPIPEGYVFVDSEEEQTETPTVQSVRPTTTQTTGDGGNDTGARVGTTMVGKTGKGITDKSLSTNQKTGMVMSALDKATTKGSLGVALQTLGTLGVPGAAALGGFDSINPDRTALDGVLGQYGYNATTANAAINDPMAAIGLNQQQAANMANSMSPTELSSPALQEALSQAMYGMSKAQATSMLGVAPTTTLGTKGYKNGQVDPTTNGTYAYGQSTDDDGSVSYGSIDDFGVSMAATAATGFMGHLGDVDRVMNSPTATQKQKNAAKNYRDRVKTPEFNAMRDDDRTSDEVSQGLGDAQTSAVTAADQAVSEATGGKTTSSTGFTDMSAFGNDVNTSNNNTSNNNDGTGDPGGTESEAGSEMGGEDVYKGSLITKRKASGKLKKKYMKRGGLASR